MEKVCRRTGHRRRNHRRHTGIHSLPQNASCLEVYVRDCEDTDEAYDKIMNVTGRKYTSKSDRKYTLQYYRYMGMAHEEKNGHHWFMVLFMR